MPKCGDDVPVEEQNQKAEALAGTVGALGSLFVSGGAFGILHLLRNRKGGGDVFGPSISNLSDDSIQSRGREGKEPLPPSEIKTRDSSLTQRILLNRQIYIVPACMTKSTHGDQSYNDMLDIWGNETDSEHLDK